MESKEEKSFSAEITEKSIKEKIKELEPLANFLGEQLTRRFDSAGIQERATQAFKYIRSDEFSEGKTNPAQLSKYIFEGAKAFLISEDEEEVEKSFLEKIVQLTDMLGEYKKNKITLSSEEADLLKIILFVLQQKGLSSNWDFSIGGRFSVRVFQMLRKEKFSFEYGTSKHQRGLSAATFVPVLHYLNKCRLELNYDLVDYLFSILSVINARLPQGEEDTFIRQLTLLAKLVDIQSSAGFWQEALNNHLKAIQIFFDKNVNMVSINLLNDFNLNLKKLLIECSNKKDYIALLNLCEKTLEVYKKINTLQQTKDLIQVAISPVPEKNLILYSTLALSQLSQKYCSQLKEQSFCKDCSVKEKKLTITLSQEINIRPYLKLNGVTISQNEKTVTIEPFYQFPCDKLIQKIDKAYKDHQAKQKNFKEQQELKARLEEGSSSTVSIIPKPTKEKECITIASISEPPRKEVKRNRRSGRKNCSSHQTNDSAGVKAEKEILEWKKEEKVFSKSTDRNVHDIKFQYFSQGYYHSVLNDRKIIKKLAEQQLLDDANKALREGEVGDGFNKITFCQKEMRDKGRPEYKFKVRFFGSNTRVYGHVVAETKDAENNNHYLVNFDLINQKSHKS